MRRVALSYTLDPVDDGAASAPVGVALHPLPALLAAVHETGSISGAARRMGLSYRHVWGELKRWEAETGQPLVTWVRGQPARLAPAGERLLQAERLAQARLAPQLDAVRQGLAQAFHAAFDAPLPVLTVCAGHDPLLLLLRELAARRQLFDLRIAAVGGNASPAALHDGRAGLAWLHGLADASAQSPSAQALRPWLDAGAQRLVAVATRTLGLMVAPGNPQQLAAPDDLARGGLRLAAREPGSTTRLALADLLHAARVDASAVLAAARVEPTQEAVAEAVASGFADAGLGDAALAGTRGLGFVPLAQAQCCLVVPRALLAHTTVVALLELLRTPAWRDGAQAMAGVRTLRSGEVLTLPRLLLWWGAGGP